MIDVQATITVGGLLLAVINLVGFTLLLVAISHLKRP